MDEDGNGRDKRKDRIIAWVGAVAALVAAFITVLTFFHDVDKDNREREAKEAEAQETERSHQPHFKAKWAGEVPFGTTNCGKIFMELTNKDIQITSGTFGVDHIVVVEAEGIREVIVWEGVLEEQQIAYDEGLQGCVLLVDRDYRECESRTREICEGAGLENGKYRAYFSLCFQYVEDGEQKEAYYLLDLEEEKMTEPQEPDEYKGGICMEL